MGEGMVGNNLKNKRTSAGLTQEDIAQRTSVTRQTIIAMEKGNYIPSVLLALKLSGVLYCTVEELFYVEELR